MAMDRACPVCGASTVERRWIVAGKSDIQGAPLTLVHCSACGHDYQPVLPADAAFARWYDYMGKQPASFTLSGFVQHRNSRTLARFAPYRCTGRLLDVGCGGGQFLRAAEALGWTPYGTEFSRSCVEALRPWLGDHMYEGALASAPFPQRSFDVVTLFEVVEHVSDPLSILRGAFELLRPGGVVWLTTPHRRGLAGRLLGDDWRVVGDEHLSYFTRPQLALVLKRAGFDPIDVFTSGIDPEAIRQLVPARSTRAVSTGTSIASVPFSSSPPPAVSARDRLKSGVTDIVNFALRRAGLGDGLRAFAERPAES